MQAIDPPDRLVIKYASGNTLIHNIVAGLNVTFPVGSWHEVLSSDPRSLRSMVSQSNPLHARAALYTATVMSGDELMTVTRSLPAVTVSDASRQPGTDHRAHCPSSHSRHCTLIHRRTSLQRSPTHW